MSVKKTDIEDQVAEGPEQVMHLTAPGEAALLACLEALLPPAVDARTLIDIGAVYVDHLRCVLVLDSKQKRAYLCAHAPSKSSAELHDARAIVHDTCAGVWAGLRPGSTTCGSGRAPICACTAAHAVSRRRRVSTGRRASCRKP